MFADTTDTKVANTVAVLEEAGRGYWAPRRYDTYHRGITVLDYGQAVPVLVATLEQLQEHGADAAVWRRLGREGEQTLTAALDNPDGDALYRRQAARADAEEKQRRAAEREAQRPVCKECGEKFTDQRWEETTTRNPWKTGNPYMCRNCWTARWCSLISVELVRTQSGGVCPCGSVTTGADCSRGRCPLRRDGPRPKRRDTI